MMAIGAKQQLPESKKKSKKYMYLASKSLIGRTPVCCIQKYNSDLCFHEKKSCAPVTQQVLVVFMLVNINSIPAEAAVPKL